MSRKTEIFTVLLRDLQPSQFYISEKKLSNVEAWFNPSDLSNFEPIPVKMLAGAMVMTDGHTRAVAALKAGIDEVPIVWDTDDLDWDMYRRCVEECRERHVFTPSDLVDRVVSESEYAAKWDQWCDEMQADVKRGRAERTGETK